MTVTASMQMLSIEHEVVLGGRAVYVLEVDGAMVVITCGDGGTSGLALAATRTNESQNTGHQQGLSIVAVTDHIV